MKKFFTSSSILLLDILAFSSEVAAQEAAAGLNFGVDRPITEALVEKFTSFVDHTTTVAAQNSLKSEMQNFGPTLNQDFVG